MNKNLIMNLAPIGTCKKCGGGYFINGSCFGNYCCKECEYNDSGESYDIIALEKRISELEARCRDNDSYVGVLEERLSLFERRLERCVKKLGIDFSSKVL